MIKILFVCHGNICRSPMAEFVMKDLVQRAGLENDFFISSAATSTEEIWNGVGNPVYPPAKSELARHGIACGGKRAVLLKKEDYDPICAKRLVKEPYLLLYIPLGYNSDYQKAAKKYAKENGLKVIELSYFTWNNLSHTVIADAGIEDFLSLIRNAEVVFTNSFHAVCFSLLFHVDFYAFARKTGRKTEDFCSWIGISERYLDILKFKKAEPIDYEKIDKILEQKRKESLEWLAEALEK